MRAITLDAGESEVFARAALALKYDEDKPAPITESQILMPRRHDDDRRDLWSVFNRRSEEHTSELQSLMRISYSVFCLKTKKTYKPSQSEYIYPLNVETQHLNTIQLTANTA